MKENLKSLSGAFNEVFYKTSYILLASTLALIAFIFAVWLPNLGLITDIFANSSAPFANKLKVALVLLGGIRTNFSFFSAGYTIAIVALFGVNTAMTIFFLKKKRNDVLAHKNATAGFGGVVTGVLGIGCASCGSFVLSAAFSFFGAAGALTILPLRGGEFGILSVALLAVSILFISKKIVVPLTCSPCQKS